MHNLQAELGILGCILMDNEIIKEISLTDEHFYDYQCKSIFNAMRNVSRKDQLIDNVTLVEELGHQTISKYGGVSFFSQLRNSVTSIHGFKTYEKIIIDDWKKRTARNVLRESLEKEIDPTEIQKVITELNTIDQVGTKDSFNLKEHLVNMYNLPDEPVPKGLSGIPSGLIELDKMTDGFQNEDSIIIGARPSMGKTALILNIAINAGKKDVVVVIFSLEMSAESLIKRSLSAIGSIDGIKTRNPFNYFNDKDKGRWKYAIGELEKINLHIFDKPQQKVNEMRAKVRQVKKDHPGKKVLVLIDYLTLIKPNHDHNGNAHLQVSEISSDLKSMAKEFKIPVVTLAQLSRGVETRQNKKPVMSDLRESGSIEQDADVIMFLYREDYYNDESESKNILEIDIAKQRNGPTGVVEVYYKKEYNLVSDLEKRYDN